MERVRKSIKSDALEAERLESRGLDVRRLDDGTYAVENMVAARLVKKTRWYKVCGRGWSARG